MFKPLKIKLMPVDENVISFPVGGLHHDWISGEKIHPDHDKVEFSLTCGAGLGNATMCLRVDAKGKTYNFNTNMAENLEGMMNQVMYNLLHPDNGKVLLLGKEYDIDTVDGVNKLSDRINQCGQHDAQHIAHSLVTLLVQERS